MIYVSRRLVFFLLVLVASEFCVPANADVVSAEWVTKIETYLSEVDSNTTAEIVVFVVQSLIGHGIKNKDGSEITEIVKLGVYIFNELPLDIPGGQVTGIGKQGKDNGVLVLVAMEQREWRIEVGYGLEGDITDIESNLIAQQHLVPKFTEGEYGEGLYDTIVALSEEIQSQPEPPAIRGRYFYESTSQFAADELPPWAIALIAGVIGAVAVVIIVFVYLVKKGKIKVERTSSRGGWGGGGGRSGGGGGSRGGSRRGGRSGGGGSKGKWA